MINEFSQGEATKAHVTFWVSGGPEVAGESMLEPTG
jgi:hypothetical protein